MRFSSCNIIRINTSQKRSCDTDNKSFEYKIEVNFDTYIFIILSRAPLCGTEILISSFIVLNQSLFQGSFNEFCCVFYV